VSSDTTFDISEECANVGVVIRRGILPILCIAAKIKCKNSEDDKVLGIALGVKKVVEKKIYDFKVQIDLETRSGWLMLKNKQVRKKKKKGTYPMT
jgi:hypothetical protein